MAIDARIQAALLSPDPLRELRSVAQTLRSEGESHDAILELFEQTRRQLRESNREPEEDLVMEAMDLLVGWCSPHVKLDRP